jgi:hypothetical protein
MLSRWGGRAVVVLIGIRVGTDGVNLIYYDTIHVCDSFIFYSHSIDLNEATISWHSQRPFIVLILPCWFAG